MKQWFHHPWICIWSKSILLTIIRIDLDRDKREFRRSSASNPNVQYTQRKRNSIYYIFSTSLNFSISSCYHSSAFQFYMLENYRYATKRPKFEAYVREWVPWRMIQYVTGCTAPPDPLGNANHEKTRLFRRLFRKQTPLPRKRSLFEWVSRRRAYITYEKSLEQKRLESVYICNSNSKLYN